MTHSAPRSPATLVPFASDHVPAAAALVTARVARLRGVAPDLPEAWAASELPGAALAELASRGESLVALEGEDVVGFQGAMVLDGHGGRWAYTADIAHAAAGTNPRAVTEALYATLAERWVQSGCIEHVVTVLADDAVALAAFAQLGFGATTVDLVRDLDPVVDAAGAGVHGGFRIRRAGPADAGTIVLLEDGLRRHLAATPVFFVPGPQASLELHRRRLDDSATATFVAEDGDTPIAYLRIGPCATDVATVVRDPSTASITAAFTVLDRRGAGVAGALLDAAVAWARDGGFARCAVDHESANLEAARFWRRHFTPVAYSLTRRLPARLAR